MIGWSHTTQELQPLAGRAERFSRGEARWAGAGARSLTARRLLHLDAMSPPRTTWKIEAANSELRFTVSHLVISKISGRFGRFWGTVHLDEEDVRRSAAELVIEAGSIDTGNAERDRHLRSAEFLDAQHHPAIRFRSTEIVPAGRSDYLVNGELTIRDVTLPVTVFVTDRGRVRDDEGKLKAAFYAHGGFNRQEFGMSWHNTMDAGGVLVGDEVEVHVDAEAFEVPEVEEIGSRGEPPARAGSAPR